MSEHKHHEKKHDEGNGNQPNNPHPGTAREEGRNGEGFPSATPAAPTQPGTPAAPRDEN